MQTALLTAVGALLLLVPGFLVLLAVRVRPHVAAVVAIPVTFGMVVVGSMVTGVAGIPWNPWTALATLAVFLAAAVAYSVGLDFRGRRRADAAVETAEPGVRGSTGHHTLPERLAPEGTWWSVSSAVVGVLVGIGTIFMVCLRGLRRSPDGIASLSNVWDELWHANLIRFIADTGVADATDLGRLFQVETHHSFYYPDAWHALGALVLPLTGRGILPVINLWTVTSLALVIPLSAAALAWRLVRDRFSPSAAGISAGCAAAVSGLLPSLPYVEVMVTANPNAVGAAMVGMAAVLVMSVTGAPRRIPLAALALVGIAGVHPSGAAATAVLLAVWWVFDSLWRPRHRKTAPGRRFWQDGRWRTRGREAAALVSVGVIAAVILLPQISGVLGNVGGIEAYDFTDAAPRLTAVHDVFTLQNEQTIPFDPPWVLLGIAVAGGVFLLVRRSVWMMVVWAFLLVAAVDATESIGGLPSDAIRKFSNAFYTDPRRIEYVIALIVVALAGVGIGLAIHGARCALRRWVPDRRYARTGVLAIMLVAVPVAAGSSVSRYADQMSGLVSADRAGRMVSPKDRDALEHLAALPHARDTTIFVNPDQGLGWMYALEGLHPLFTHFAFPEPMGDRTWALWDRINTAGANPRVDAALRELNVKYVITSPPVYWPFQVVPRGLVDLQRTPGLELVYDNGETEIFEVSAWEPQAPGEKLYGWDPFADRSDARPWRGPAEELPAWAD